MTGVDSVDDGLPQAWHQEGRSLEKRSAALTQYPQALAPSCSCWHLGSQRKPAPARGHRGSPGSLRARWPPVSCCSSRCPSIGVAVSRSRRPRGSSAALSAQT